MKTVITSLMIIAFTIPALAGMENSTKAVELEEESYIDDIPFNTLDVLALQNIELQEEKQVDDIPFDTECIVQALDKDCTNWIPCLLPFDGRTLNLLETSLNEIDTEVFVEIGL